VESTAVIAPPSGSWESSEAPQSTAVLPREEVAVGLDPNESDADWEARVLAACAPGRRVRGRVLGVRD
jgi:hypothetical protein